MAYTPCIALILIDFLWENEPVMRIFGKGGKAQKWDADLQ